MGKEILNIIQINQIISEGVNVDSKSIHTNPAVIVGSYYDGNSSSSYFWYFDLESRFSFATIGCGLIGFFMTFLFPIFWIVISDFPHLLSLLSLNLIFPK